VQAPGFRTQRMTRYTPRMAGIIFLRTARFDDVRAFYTEEIGMTVWLEQPDIAILRHENLLIGFHRQPEADLDGLITFFYETRDEVDQVYVRLRDVALAEPRENPKYKIYHFFGVDPEGRKIEFQQFLHPVPEIPGTGAATTSSA
jgi:catechol 2,3-dioxygenase-like lactoylglutathione lyase family enzyme